MPKIKRYKGVRQLPDGRFLVRYPDVARKYHERILERHEAETLENAIGILDGLRAKVEAGERPWEKVAPTPPEPVLTFNRWADTWLEEYSKPALRSYIRDRSRLNVVRRHFGEMDIKGIGLGDVAAFRKRLKDDGYADASINSTLAMFRRVMHKAKKAGKVASVPEVEMIRLDQPGRVKFLSEEEEALILAHAPDWLRPMILFSIHTGLRLSEMVRLRRRDVNMEKGCILVEKSKSRKPRTIPMDDTTRLLLQDVLRVHHLNDDRVFRFGEYYISHSFTRLVRTVSEKVEAAIKRGERHMKLNDRDKIEVERIDLTGMVWHCLRHTWASRLVMSGCPLLTVMKLGGWSRLDMVQIYAHTSPEHEIEAVRKAERAFSGSKIWSKFGLEAVEKAASS